MSDHPYHLVIHRVEPAGGGAATVVFAVEPHAGELHVRLGADESITLIAERAGLSTPRARMALTLGRLAEHLDASLEHVRLRCVDGTIIAASLMVGRGPLQIELPVCFGEAMALAVTHHLPIVGDASLRPLLRVTQAAVDEPDVALPETIVAFVNSLSDR